MSMCSRLNVCVDESRAGGDKLLVHGINELGINGGLVKSGD